MNDLARIELPAFNPIFTGSVERSVAGHLSRSIINGMQFAYPKAFADHTPIAAALSFLGELWIKVRWAVREEFITSTTETRNLDEPEVRYASIITKTIVEQFAEVCRGSWKAADDPLYLFATELTAHAQRMFPL